MVYFSFVEHRHLAFIALKLKFRRRDLGAKTLIDCSVDKNIKAVQLWTWRLNPTNPKSSIFFVKTRQEIKHRRYGGLNARTRAPILPHISWFYVKMALHGPLKAILEAC
jgi:hypothetical protein